jgi:cytochrome oxidase assembly protein ShyY1
VPRSPSESPTVAGPSLDLPPELQEIRERRVNGEVVASPPPPKKGKHPTDYSFVYKPRWILSHLFVLACVVTFLLCANWQLNRYHGRVQINSMLEQRMAVAPVPISTLIHPHEVDAIANHDAYRRVTVTGHYDNSQQILIQMEQDAESDPGYWLVTPLILPNGNAVAINRGFVPLGLDEGGPLLAYRPPSGTVTVTGMLYPTQNRTGGPKDKATGHLDLLSRVDLHRWQKQLSYTIYPLYVNLETSKPAQHGNYPEPVPLPTLDDGPHLNYFGQWLIFAGLTVIVYPLLLRRVARNRMVTEEDALAGLDARTIRDPADLVDDPDDPMDHHERDGPERAGGGVTT